MAYTHDPWNASYAKKNLKKRTYWSKVIEADRPKQLP